MTARMYYDNDADPSALAGQTVAIIGYGSQGHAHALNLHEGGVDVVVGLAPGSKSRAHAEEAGLRVADVADAVKAADVVMILVPDTAQKALYDAGIPATELYWPNEPQSPNTLEILGAHAEQIAGRDVPLTVRDPLTTLITAPVLELALAQEIQVRPLVVRPSATVPISVEDLARRGEPGLVDVLRIAELLQEEREVGATGEAGELRGVVQANVE